MSDDNDEFDKYESHKYQKLLPINSPQIQSEELSSFSIDPKQFKNSRSISSESSTLDPKNLSTISELPISNTPSRLSFSSNTSTETTKSELIQRILDSFKPTCSSDNTTNTSLSFSNKTITSCQSLNLSNKIYIHFKDENELGVKPHINDLLEKIEDTKKCSCHRIEINFNNQSLNQRLSYKQKQSLLRIILRRQQIFDQYFS